MSRYDHTNVEKVANRGPDGLWACCLCTGWKNRECGNKDFKFNDHEIFLHLRDKHFIYHKTLQQSNRSLKEPVDVTAINAFSDLITATRKAKGDIKY